jgi:hypothetical protein
MSINQVQKNKLIHVNNVLRCMIKIKLKIKIYYLLINSELILIKKKIILTESNQSIKQNNNIIH